MVNLVNYIPLLIIVAKSLAGHWITSGYTMLTIALSYLSLVYDFTNLEGQYIEETIVNTAIKGEVVIHYVVKVGEEYISFEDFAYDEDGNLKPMFENVNVHDIVLIGKIEDEFETSYEKINGLTLEGLYIGNLIDGDNLNKLVNDKYNGVFEEGTQEFTYVFEINVGSGEDYPMPPQTGVEINTHYLYLILVCFCSFVLKKIFV